MRPVTSNRFAVFLLLLLMQACAPEREPQRVAAVAMERVAAVSTERLLFEETEPGFEAYPVRVLVSAGYVRIDDNRDEGDFILYERETATIYNVTREDGTVLEIRSGSEVPSIPGELRIEETAIVDQQAPAVAGRQPVHIGVSANGTRCYELIQLPGMLPDGLGGLAEYSRALGNRQLAQLDKLLPEQGTPCFLVRYAYAADRPCRGGLPLAVWDSNGYRRTLIDYGSRESASGELFTLPATYRVYRLEGADQPDSPSVSSRHSRAVQRSTLP